MAAKFVGNALKFNPKVVTYIMCCIISAQMLGSKFPPFLPSAISSSCCLALQKELVGVIDPSIPKAYV